jgi:hypothetical protein
MASEMRRVAKALVERRSESFASRYPRDESIARLKKALEGFAPTRLQLESAWHEGPEGLRLDVRFNPARRTDWFLKASSVFLTLLMGSAVWAWLAPGEDRTVKFLVPLLTVLGILAFPFVVVALGSQREAEESRLRRAIRRALVDEDEKFPPQQRWADEN